MYSIGIDLGGTNTALGIVENGKVISSLTVITKEARDEDTLCQNIFDAVNMLLKESKIGLNEIESIGIGMPGAVERKTGKLIFAPNLSVKSGDICRTLSKISGKKVFGENDANVYALGEYIVGSGKSSDSFVCITLGTGIGAGIILNGKIYSGLGGAAGELGHTVIKSGGRKCNCGKKGCFEAYASVSALINDTKAAMRKDKASLLWQICGGDIKAVSGKTVFKAAKKGDKTAMAVLDCYFDYLAEGTANIINLIRPQILCIGGGLANEGEALLNPLKKRLESMIFSYKELEKPLITTSKLKENAAIIGAAQLSLFN